MKRTIVALCFVMVMFAFAGCYNGKTTPTPMPSASALPRPTASPVVSNSPDASPSAGMTPGTTGDITDPGAGTPGTGTPGDGTPGAGIEGFVEGDEVDVAALPDSIIAAVKEKYPEATISKAVFATNTDVQSYLLTLTGADEKQVYVTSDGVISPYSAAGTNP